MKESDIASYIFKQNLDNNPMVLTFPAISNLHELFSFFVSLTIQGVMYMCGDPINIDEIKTTQLEFIQLKMENAGIKVNITTLPPMVDTPKIETRSKTPVHSIADIALFVHTSKSTDVIVYEIVRKCLIPSCHVAEKFDRGKI
jgi:hypothetical protein